MAAIDNYVLNVTVRGTEAVESLNKKIEGLGKVILGVGLVEFTRHIIEMIDTVNDLSAATGIAAGDIRAFQSALVMSGGQADDAAKIIAQFYKTLEDASGGADKAVDTLEKLGIAQQDLTKYSSQELFTKGIQGLAKMEAGARRGAIAVEAFGKAMKTVDPGELAKNNEEAAKSSDALGESFKKNDELVKSLKQSYTNLQDAAVKVLGDLVGAHGEFTLSVEQAEKVIKAVGIAFATYYSGKTLVTFISLMKDLTNILKEQAKVQAIIAALSGPKGWAGLAAAAVIAGGAYLYFKDSSDKVSETMDDNAKAIDNAKKAWDSYNLTIQSLQDALKNGRIDQAKFTEEVQKADEIRRKMLGEKPKTEGPKEAPAFTGVDPTQAQKAAAAEKAKTVELKKQLDLDYDLVKLQYTLLGQSQDYIDEQVALRNILNDTLSKQAAVQKDIDAETAQGSKANKERIAELTQQKGLYDQQAARLTEITEKTAAYGKSIKTIREQTQQYLTVYEAIGNLRVFEKQADALRYTGELRKLALRDAENINRRDQEQLNFAKQINEQYLNNLANVKDIEKLQEAIGQAAIFRIKIENDAKAGLISNEQAQNLLLKNREDLLNTIYELNTRLTPEQKEQLENLVKANEAISDISNSIAELNVGMSDTSSYLQGVRESVDQISNSMTPLQMAQDAVMTTWSDMGKAIDNFVETGKFSFKDFARSIVADLTKMILKAELFNLLMSAFGGYMPSSGGLGAGTPGGFGSVAYAAAGAEAQPNQPFIVGEKGPEMFVPKTAGTIVPNDKMGQGGPSNVTNNYYNINAVDAKSVARLFTENRQALLGASKQAEKELPYRVR